MLTNQSRIKHDVVEYFWQHIIGQKEAKIALARVLENLNNPLFTKKWPLYKALYYWPTGSGKTSMAKTLARLLFSDEYGYTHINCESMQHWHEVAKLFWAPPWYVGSDKEPFLSEESLYASYNSAKSSGRLMKGMQPTTIIVFDEIEKAHPDISRSLMSILDEGMIYLQSGEQVDIRNSFIFLTSNIGEQLIQNIRQWVWFNSTQRESKENVRERALKSFFAPEFLGRLDDIIEFEKIEWDNLYLIIDKLMGELTEDIEWLWKKYITITLTDKAKENIKQNVGGSIRDMERYFHNNIRNKLGNVIMSNVKDFTRPLAIEIDYDWTFIFNETRWDLPSPELGTPEKVPLSTDSQTTWEQNEEQ